MEFMIAVLKERIKGSFVYDVVKNGQQRQAVRDWKRRGKPSPPPHLVKQRTIKEYADRFPPDLLIETDTYLGDMVNAVRHSFRQIISIELDQRLYERTKKRFARYSHINILQGDSAEVLPQILTELTEPCLFWLDGHYSGGVTAKGELETPIMQELANIVHHPVVGHVVLIDDARQFGRQPDYPTIEELRTFILGALPDWVCDIWDDIIRIHAAAPTSAARRSSDHLPGSN